MVFNELKKLAAMHNYIQELNRYGVWFVCLQFIKKRKIVNMDMHLNIDGKKLEYET